MDLFLWHQYFAFGFMWFAHRAVCQLFLHTWERDMRAKKLFPWLPPIIFVCNKFCSFMSPLPYSIPESNCYLSTTRTAITNATNERAKRRRDTANKSEWKSKCNMSRNLIQVETLFILCSAERKNHLLFSVRFLLLSRSLHIIINAWFIHFLYSLFWKYGRRTNKLFLYFRHFAVYLLTACFLVYACVCVCARVNRS